MMKKVLTLFLIVFVAISTTSCINIIEKLFFNKDGSGQYTMSVDMSGIAKMVEEFGGGADELDEALAGTADEFGGMADKLESIEGISGVTQQMDEKNLTFTYNFDFADVNALNAALSQNYHEEETDGPTVKQKVYYEATRKGVKRTDIDPMLDALNEMEDVDDMGMDMGTLFSDMYYEYILEFEKNIKSVSNKDYVKDGDNSIRLKRYFFKSDDIKKKIQVEIKTK